jgi:hypothetical protein
MEAASWSIMASWIEDRLALRMWDPASSPSSSRAPVAWSEASDSRQLARIYDIACLEGTSGLTLDLGGAGKGGSVFLLGCVGVSLLLCALVVKAFGVISGVLVLGGGSWREQWRAGHRVDAA